MDEDQIFVATEIRNTSNHNSLESPTGEFTAQTIFIENSLNQAVTFQLQGCRKTGSTWLNIGTAFNIAASTNDYETVSDYFPCYRLVASCLVAPTTGNLNVWLIKSKG